MRMSQRAREAWHNQRFRFANDRTSNSRSVIVDADPGISSINGALNFATPDSTSNTDPLQNEDLNQPLKGTMMLLSVQPGDWARDIDDFIRYARDEQPEIFVKYFGGNIPLSSSVISVYQ